MIIIAFITPPPGIIGAMFILCVLGLLSIYYGIYIIRDCIIGGGHFISKRRGERSDTKRKQEFDDRVWGIILGAPFYFGLGLFLIYLALIPAGLDSNVNDMLNLIVK